MSLNSMLQIVGGEGLRLEDGQAVQLEDGTTAYIHTPKGNHSLCAVNLLFKLYLQICPNYSAVKEINNIGPMMC